MRLRPFIVKQLDYDITPVAGLALVGHYLQALQPVLKRVDAAMPVRGGVANSDILRVYLGLLVQGKSDFDAIENYRGDAFFKQALGVGLLPSSPTLRQQRSRTDTQLTDPKSCAQCASRPGLQRAATRRGARKRRPAASDR